jgi:alkanesulfonate monooxygenase SsuD/methylene tetrahydromethanopterin reductase-like flavin-dependent oxidoreductase (luciferase family)
LAAPLEVDGMEIGTGLFTCQRRPDDDRSMREIYDEMRTLGQAVDDAGLDSAWVSEHHFADDGYLPGTMPSLAALAEATDDVRVGTCIALAPLYDPVRLAEDAATVSLLSDGRLDLGMSIGYVDHEFDNFGVPKEERTDRTEEAVELLRAAWSDGPLDVDPEFHAVSPEMTVTPKPEDAPPILLGGSARPAVRRAARIADGWIAPSSISIGGVKKRKEDIESVREEEDVDGDFQTYVIQHGFVADSKEEAWEAMKEGYFYMSRKYAEWAEGEPVDELPAEQREAMKKRAIFGTPEDVVENLERYRGALGDDVHFIFRMYFPGAGTDTMCESIERFGDEVLPHFE